MIIDDFSSLLKFHSSPVLIEGKVFFRALLWRGRVILCFRYHDDLLAKRFYEVHYLCNETGELLKPTHLYIRRFRYKDIPQHILDRNLCFINLSDKDPTSPHNAMLSMPSLFD